MFIYSKSFYICDILNGILKKESETYLSGNFNYISRRVKKIFTKFLKIFNVLLFILRMIC